MLDKAKQLYQLQKKAKEVQKELKNTEIEARSTDDLISVVMSADQKIKEIKISQEILSPANKSELEDKLMKVISECLSRTQAVAAEKTKTLMGDMGLNIPGM